jgi:hypothetical protein
VAGIARLGSGPSSSQRSPHRAGAALEQRLGQLLDEQRHAVGARDDLRRDLRRERLAAGDAADQGLDIRRGEARQRQDRRMPVVGPRRHEFRARRRHQQERQARDLLHRVRQLLERRGVDPVQVLEHGEDGSTGAEPPYHLHEQIERALLEVLRGEIGRRIAGAAGDGEEGREQRHLRVRPGAGRGQRGLELAELGLGAVAVADAGCALELRDDRMQRGVAMVRRAVVDEGRAALRRAGRAGPGWCATCRCRARP